MVIFDKSTYCNLNDFGILVPMCASRPEMIIKTLQQHNSLFPILDLKEAKKLIGLSNEEMSITREDLERVHDKKYIAKLYNDPKSVILRAYEIINEDGNMQNIDENEKKPATDYSRYDPSKAVRPIEDIFTSSINRVEGCYLTALLAMSQKCMPIKNFCYFLEGGAHHTRYDAPSGFGFLNDMLITSQKLIHGCHAQLIWIVDVDAHKGDGTAEMIKFSRDMGSTFVGRNPEIIALSTHMAHGWPLDAESLAKAVPGRAPLVPSDIDIPIDVGQEGEFCSRLEKGLLLLEEKSGGRKPDLVIIDDGMDVYEKDELPSTSLINLSLDQCMQRSKLLFSFFAGRKIPSAWYMAGGYGDKVWEPTAKFLLSL
ncbi:MAG: hypothetical protein Ta2B_23840 [Termitinemataceae bacterium]|nr:MAG: hypothetical protein Ta2B_23840 [Termitinemataceae bacterium]